MSYSSKLQRETVLGSVIIRPTANAFSRGCSIVRKKTPATPTPARLRVHYKNLSTRREKIFHTRIFLRRRGVGVADARARAPLTTPRGPSRNRLHRSDSRTPNARGVE